ncbi:hypothetical protein EC845_0684 [Comamonas sp. BIGb0124]|uniref:hypothetical protein n=1 Tax=Comamonas sp. BIGb0124 TaxID=2485130 RepID=UPI000F917606|nr:hypothetical protein [Comamonas sp. BIGb0124]ROR24659.1 hypothetical protein EC845_0684 [Comamonas sp. BIGb0124]
MTTVYDLGMEKTPRSNAKVFGISAVPMLGTGLPFTVLGVTTANITFLIVGVVFLVVGTALSALGLKKQKNSADS